VVVTSDAWDPEQYNRFKTERRQPFHDLLALTRPVPGGRMADLGCGGGELTLVAHAYLQVADTIGVDNSAAMLARAKPYSDDGVRFEEADIGSWQGSGFDVILANASLQWLPDHEALLGRLTAALNGGGQLAFQVPTNGDHPSQKIIRDVASEDPFLDALGELPPDHNANVLTPVGYASLLDQLGFAEQHVRLRVYGHRLSSVAEVVEWVKGSALTPYRSAMPGDVFNELVSRYRQRLVDQLGDRRPYFYPFKRILCWSRRP
jgi:trans-aconitate 2-methyltransferase